MAKMVGLDKFKIDAIQGNDPNLIPANILSGISIFGVAGTAINGAGMKKYASGNGTLSGNTLAVSGLSFAPYLVDIYMDGDHYFMDKYGIEMDEDVEFDFTILEDHDLSDGVGGFDFGTN